jgi:pyruvate, orthophosphate dikinase
MFFKKDRLPFMQEMILATTKEERVKALEKLIKFQADDFYSLFKTMKNLPVTIRTLDPPLHEFLPKTETEAQELSKKIGVSVTDILNKTKDLHEINPMLGHRGCRLSITYPEILEMQVKAIVLAALKLKKSKAKVIPEIMIPLVSNVNEFLNQKEIVLTTIKKILKEKKTTLTYKIGTMIEIPRAVLTADKIAEHADFFSFGTNDLTQMGMGFSRDDAGKFIKIYLDKGIFKNDPFQTIDKEGIGELIKIGVKKGREVKKDLKIGICGEHGGDPQSIDFCHLNDFSYVSCSPFRVPIAKLSSAQSFLKNKKK